MIHFSIQGVNVREEDGWKQRSVKVSLAVSPSRQPRFCLRLLLCQLEQLDESAAPSAAGSAGAAR